MSSVKTLYREITIPPLLNPGSIADLVKELHDFEKENVNFLVLKGTAPVFCNGLDLQWVTHHVTSDHMKEMQEYGAFLKKVQTGAFISIAQVNGSASGGGMGIVCACDHVIASKESTYSLPEGLLGLIPGMILPTLLNRLTPQRIKKMVFTGQKYDGKVAADWGLVDEIVDEKKMQGALEAAILTMKSCKKGSTGDLKKILYEANINKDDLSEKGMTLLSQKLKDTEINERLKDIADFLGEK